MKLALSAAVLVALLSGCGSSKTTELPPALEPTVKPGYVQPQEADYALLDSLKAQATGYFNQPRIEEVYQYFGVGGTFVDQGITLTIYGSTFRYPNGSVSILYDYAAVGYPCIAIYVGSHELVHADQIFDGTAWDFSLPYMQQLHEIDAYTRGPIYAKYFAEVNGYACDF